VSAERIDLRHIAQQPWKNGAGLTREIAFGGASAADFDWRLSVAEVDRDAPFSHLPGVDRCITLLTGPGMRLRSSDGSVDHRLTAALAPFHFSGDVALNATLVRGACSDFNVMTRRGRFRSEVEVHRTAASLSPGDVTLLLSVSGRWLAGADAIDPLQGLLWRAPLRALDIRPTAADAALLHVRLCHDRTP
jgi:environmental stress-induced protein Ves